VGAWGLPRFRQEAGSSIGGRYEIDCRTVFYRSAALGFDPGVAQCATPEEKEMFALTRSLYFVAGLTVLAATPSFAQQSARVQQGAVHSAFLKNLGKAMPRGTIFFANNGQFYRNQTSKNLFDNF
jgi:hypothetical protein